MLVISNVVEVIAQIERKITLPRTEAATNLPFLCEMGSCLSLDTASVGAVISKGQQTNSYTVHLPTTTCRGGEFLALTRGWQQQLGQLSVL